MNYLSGLATRFSSYFVGQDKQFEANRSSGVVIVPDETAEEIRKREEFIAQLDSPKNRALIAAIVCLAVAVLGLGLCFGGQVGAGMSLMIFGVMGFWTFYNCYKILDTAQEFIRNFRRELQSECFRRPMKKNDAINFIDHHLNYEYKYRVKKNTILFNCMIDNIMKPEMMDKARKSAAAGNQ